MKFVCSLCKNKKESYEFHKNSSCKSRGYSYYCKECTKPKTRALYNENKQKSKELTYAWRAKNPEKLSDINSRYSKNNRAKRTYQGSIYRAYKGKATPKWLTESDLLHIKAKYQLSAMLSKNTGEIWHVDHVIPLRGKNVCGLHVPQNLKVITAMQNSQKRNEYFGE
jgi:hypothetical protein